MSEVLKDAADLRRAAPQKSVGGDVWALGSYLPAALPVVGALVMLALRIQIGGERFIDDGALMMIALACYLIGAAFHLTHLYAPSNMSQQLGLWFGSFGVFFNLSSWLVRWVAAYDRELAVLGPGNMPWIWRYIPLSNLYDYSVAFAFGAGLTTMLLSGRKSYRFIGALSLPMAALVLVLARFIGSELTTLQPVLDSYWRPIHVGTASLSYGVTLVCFAAAVIYLLKDGVKVEAMAIWSSIFALTVFATVSKYSVFTSGVYSASVFIRGSRASLPLRADLPYVGWLIVASGVLLAGVTVLFALYVFKNNLKARAWGHRLLKVSLVTQAAAIAALVSQIKSVKDVAARLSPNQFERFGLWIAEQGQMPPEQMQTLTSQQLTTATRAFIEQQGDNLILSLNANPVELSALITAFAGTMFVAIFSFRTDRLRASLPSAERLDSLMYKTASVAFAGLAVLLITGAVWANESWGRYWGWDAKETGAFVAWLTYGAFLHARISRGLTGRRAAYFAVVAFLFVIFTYLGVSYLLPGLHSYAG